MECFQKGSMFQLGLVKEVKVLVKFQKIAGLEKSLENFRKITIA
jgi:hypothetical protein